MPTIVFLITAGIGLTTTKFILRILNEREGTSNKFLALATAIGLGITWWFSFLFPIALGKNFRIEFELFVFIFATTLFIMFITYFISLLWAPHFRK